MIIKSLFLGQSFGFGTSKCGKVSKLLLYRAGRKIVIRCKEGMLSVSLLDDMGSDFIGFVGKINPIQSILKVISFLEKQLH
jgi:hypothetical protein